MNILVIGDGFYTGDGATHSELKLSPCKYPSICINLSFGSALWIEGTYH